MHQLKKLHYYWKLAKITKHTRVHSVFVLIEKIAHARIATHTTTAAPPPPPPSPPLRLFSIGICIGDNFTNPKKEGSVEAVFGAS